jgi:hypothetical protein
VTFAIGAICIKQADATDAMMSLFVRILVQIIREREQGFAHWLKFPHRTDG